MLRLLWWSCGTAGRSGSPATRCDGGGSSEDGGRGCFRLQMEGEREGKGSVECGGSEMSGRRGRGGLYLEIAGGPTRRSSGRSRALGRPGVELEVLGGSVEWCEACGGVGEAWEGLYIGARRGPVVQCAGELTGEATAHGRLREWVWGVPGRALRPAEVRGGAGEQQGGARV